MASKPRTLRMTDSAWEQVGRLAVALGTTKSEAVEKAVDNLASTYRENTPPHTPCIHDEHASGGTVTDNAAAAALEALNTQLAAKDEVIRHLMDRVEAAETREAAKDEVIARALEHAQQLHAMDKARPSIGQRIKGIFSKHTE